MKGIVSSRQYSTRISRRSTARSALRRGGKDALSAALLLAGIAVAPVAALADASNPVCPVETVFFDPGNAEDLVCRLLLEKKKTAISRLTNLSRATRRGMTPRIR